MPLGFGVVMRRRRLSGTLPVRSARVHVLAERIAAAVLGLLGIILCVAAPWHDLDAADLKTGDAYNGITTGGLVRLSSDA